MSLHGKMAIPDLQRFPLYCLIKYELDINVFVSLNYLFSFAVSLWKFFFLQLPCLKEAMEKLTEINTLIFETKKNDCLFLQF